MRRSSLDIIAALVAIANTSGTPAVLRMAIQLSVSRTHLAPQNAAVVEACVPLVSLTSESYRMRRHRDAINALRPALTGRPEGGEISRSHLGNSRDP